MSKLNDISQIVKHLDWTLKHHTFKSTWLVRSLVGRALHYSKPMVNYHLGEQQFRLIRASNCSHFIVFNCVSPQLCTCLSSNYWFVCSFNIFINACMFPLLKPAAAVRIVASLKMLYHHSSQQNSWNIVI